MEWMTKLLRKLPSDGDLDPYGVMRDAAAPVRATADEDAKRLSRQGQAALASAADPFFMPSALTGLVSPETRDAWRATQSQEGIGPQLVGGLLGGGAAYKGAMTGAKGGLDMMARALGLGVGSDVVDQTAGVDGTIDGTTVAKALLSPVGVASARIAVPAGLTGAAMLTPPSAANAAPAGPPLPARNPRDMPQELEATPPVDSWLDALSGAAGGITRVAGDAASRLGNFGQQVYDAATQSSEYKPPSWREWAEKNGVPLETPVPPTQLMKDYKGKSPITMGRTAMSAYNQERDDFAKGKARYDEAVATGARDHKAFLDRPWNERYPALSVASFVAPAVAAAAKYRGARNRHDDDIRKLTDDIAERSVSGSPVTAMQDELAALLANRPSSIPYIAAGTSAGMATKGVGDAIDMTTLPADSPARTNARMGYLPFDDQGQFQPVPLMRNIAGHLSRGATTAAAVGSVPVTRTAMSKAEMQSARTIAGLPNVEAAKSRAGDAAKMDKIASGSRVRSEEQKTLESRGMAAALEARLLPETARNEAARKLQGLSDNAPRRLPAADLDEVQRGQWQSQTSPQRSPASAANPPSQPPASLVPENPTAPTVNSQLNGADAILQRLDDMQRGLRQSRLGQALEPPPQQPPADLGPLTQRLDDMAGRIPGATDLAPVNQRLDAMQEALAKLPQKRQPTNPNAPAPYTKAHSNAASDALRALRGNATGNDAPQAALDAIKAEFVKRGLQVPPDATLLQRLKGTSEAFGSLIAGGANLDDQRMWNLAFGRGRETLALPFVGGGAGLAADPYMRALMGLEQEQQPPTDPWSQAIMGY